MYELTSPNLCTGFNRSRSNSDIRNPPTARTRRACCSRVLGMSAGRYLLLDRLPNVSRALRHAAPEPKAIAEIANRSGFSEPGLFAAVYRRAFGETPWPCSLEG